MRRIHTTLAHCSTPPTHPDIRLAPSRRLELESYLTSWFCGADPSTIYKDNVAELLAYGFWYRTR